MGLSKKADRLASSAKKIRRAINNRTAELCKQAVGA